MYRNKNGSIVKRQFRRHPHSVSAKAVVSSKVLSPATPEIDSDPAQTA